jgi:hypothetical protein
LHARWFSRSPCTAVLNRYRERDRPFTYNICVSQCISDIVRVISEDSHCGIATKGPTIAHKPVGRRPAVLLAFQTPGGIHRHFRPARYHHMGTAARMGTAMRAQQRLGLGGQRARLVTFPPRTMPSAPITIYSCRLCSAVPKCRCVYNMISGNSAGANVRRSPWSFPCHTSRGIFEGSWTRRAVVENGRRGRDSGGTIRRCSNR